MLSAGMLNCSTTVLSKLMLVGERPTTPSRLPTRSPIFSILAGFDHRGASAPYERLELGARAPVR